ncbi:interferon a3-like [Neoarius graeffei]|uniref:interferon a3-like n=1 Tax=Neoarius graeffei TaxID=443677 RepID=UPI00298D1D89|nr:interferon a3-like [Neoarius graeffei]
MKSGQSGTALYFLLFLIVHERCDACDWMMSQYSMKSRSSLSLLKDMGGEMTSVKGPFPRLVYNEVMKAKAEDQVRFLAEATEQIIVLFSPLTAHVDEVKWDGRALDNFLNILDTRQLKELKQCTAAYAERSGRSWSERKLRRHFRKLKEILKKSNYSANSLERIRNVVQQHLGMMDIITANVRHKL